MKEILTKEFFPRKQERDGQLAPPPSADLALEFGVVEPADEQLLVKYNWLMMDEFGRSFTSMEETQERAGDGEIIACIKRGTDNGSVLVGAADIGSFLCPHVPEGKRNKILALNHIAIETEYRKKYANIGTALFNYVICLARERGSSEMVLQAVDNETTRHFYREKLRLTSVPDYCGACDYCLSLDGGRHCFEA